MCIIKVLTVLLASTIVNYVVSDPIGTGGPSVVTEGKDALLTCVVMGPFENDTVIWRKGTNILAAGMNRVTSDKRISVLHDEGKLCKYQFSTEIFQRMVVVVETEI